MSSFFALALSLAALAADPVPVQPCFHARIPKVGGWAITPDYVTVVLSHPAEAKLAFFDTVTGKEARSLDLEFKPERLALRKDELFASQANSGQVFRVSLKSGEVTGKLAVSGEVVNALACHESSGPVYAATKSGAVYALDFAANSATKTTARGNHVAVDPLQHDVIYTGADGQLKDVVEISRGAGGFAARAVTQIIPNVLMKYSGSGKAMKRLSASTMASVGLEAVLDLSPNGKFAALPARGGWMSDDDRLHGGILVFDAKDLTTHLGEVEMGACINVAFHPILKLGVALGDNVVFKVFRLPSMAQRATFAGPRLPHTYWFNAMTVAGKGTRIAYLQGENFLVFDLPLDDQERSQCEKAYGDLPAKAPPVVVAKDEPTKPGGPIKIDARMKPTQPPPAPPTSKPTETPVAKKREAPRKGTKSTGPLRSVAAAKPDPADVIGSDVHAGKAGRGRTTAANSYAISAKETTKIDRTAVVFQASMAGMNSSNGDVMASVDGAEWIRIQSWTTEGCKAAAAHENWHVVLLDRGPLAGRETGQLHLRFDFKRGADHLAIQQVHWVQR